MIDKTMTQAPSIQGKTFNENPQAFNQKPVSKRDLIIQTVALATIAFVAVMLLSIIATSAFLGIPLISVAVTSVPFMKFLFIGFFASTSMTLVIREFLEIANQKAGRILPDPLDQKRNIHSDDALPPIARENSKMPHHKDHGLHLEID